MMIKGALVIAVLCYAGPMLADQSGFRVPLAGLLLDARSGSIRAIEGIPGAAILGWSLETPFKMRLAKFSDSSDFAVVVEGDGVGTVSLIRDLTRTAASQRLDGTMPGVDQLAMDGKGTVAVLYASASRQLQIVTHLPQSPLVSQVVDLAQYVDTVTALTVHESGHVLCAFSRGPSGGILEVAASGNVEMAAEATHPVAVAYLNPEGDFVFTERWSSDLTLVSKTNSGRISRIVASANDGLDQPIALASTGSGLLVANAGNNTLAQIGLVGKGADSEPSVQIVTLPVRPSRLEKLSGLVAYALNEPGDEPLYVWSLDDATTWFVPPARPVVADNARQVQVLP